MVKISVCPTDNDFVIATMTADDLIKMIIANPSPFDRDGFTCVNIVPTICAKATKKSRFLERYQYGECEDDDEVSAEVMTWMGINLGKTAMSKTAQAFEDADMVEDVCDLEPSKKINFNWLSEKQEVGTSLLLLKKKKPDDYTTRHCGRLGILDQIRQGKNLPLTVRVKVKNRVDDDNFW